MSEPLRGLLAWGIVGWAWWLLGPQLARELSELDTPLLWVLEYGWIVWVIGGFVLFAVLVVQRVKKG